MALDLETVESESGYPGFHGRVLEDEESNAPAAADSLAGFIYHDLRLPLTTILAYSELMAEDEVDRLQRKDFHKIIRLAVHRMDDLISLLLESSKLPGDLQPKATDIREVVMCSIRMVTVRPEFSRIAITYEHEGLNEGRFDAGILQRIITNVVLNACEAVSVASGKLEVKSLGQHNHLEIGIADNGPGIPGPIRDIVFQPFVSYGKTGGTGLGLAIVQKILRARGGEIYLDRTSEKGTSFRVVLPYVSTLC